MFKTTAKSRTLTTMAYALLISGFFTLAVLPTVATSANNDPIILEMGSFDSDDIKDMRRGEGKIYKKVAKAIEQLKDSGDVSENAQPVIVVVKKKSRGILD